MINTAGAYILILLYAAYNQGGITTHEMPSFDACKAALVQIEPIRNVYGYCIAKEVLK